MALRKSKIFFKAMDDDDEENGEDPQFSSSSSTGIEKTRETISKVSSKNLTKSSSKIASLGGRLFKQKRCPRETESKHPLEGSSGGLQRRGVFQFLAAKRKGSPSGKQNDSTDVSIEEEDPVVDILRSRTTQRVRFSLGHEDFVDLTNVRNTSNGPPSNSPGSSTRAPTSDLSPSTRKKLSRFIKGGLFAHQERTVSQMNLGKEYENEAAKQLRLARIDERTRSSDSPRSTMVWTSAGLDMEEVHTKVGSTSDICFEEDNSIRENVLSLLTLANRKRLEKYKYAEAVDICMKAHRILDEAGYPEDHSIRQKAVNELNMCHNSLVSYKHSANIIKMGIKYEDNGELIRALKMYTIAYRIRRDNLGRLHPSLMVLLNMLGSIQLKRGELSEAMEIFQLALDDANREADECQQAKIGVDFMARSVSFREMGIIYEKWGDRTRALEMFHLSLDCIAEYKNISQAMMDKQLQTASETKELILDEYIGLTKSFRERISSSCAEDDGMEIYIGSKKGKNELDRALVTSSIYDVFFPPGIVEKGEPSCQHEMDASDVDVALTLHQIAQLHRAQGEFQLSLAAFNVALRGMKYSLGPFHPNVAAILGNMGNLQKEMGEFDAAFSTYQQVLKIESDRLGVTHPAVIVTLHNIATIDAARGKNKQSLMLYEQVLQLQRKLHGVDHSSVAITSACMGDVHEKIGNLKDATECFEEAVRIKTNTSGRHSLEVARLLHKLGKLASSKSDYHLADSYITRALLIYRLNKLKDEDEWVIAAERDSKDAEYYITMGKKSPINDENVSVYSHTSESEEPSKSSF